MRSRGDVGRELCRCGISVSRPQFSSFVPEFLFFRTMSLASSKCC